MEPIDPVAEISGLNDADSVQQTYADVQTSIRQVSWLSMGRQVSTCITVHHEHASLALESASDCSVH